jgi:hypothetical protein
MKKFGIAAQEYVRPVILKDPPQAVTLRKWLDYGPGMHKADERQAWLSVGYSTRNDEATNIAPRGVNPFSNDRTIVKLDTFRPPDNYESRDRNQPLSRKLIVPFYQRMNPHTEDHPQQIDTSIKHSMFLQRHHPSHVVRTNPASEGLTGADRSGKYDYPIWRNTPPYPFVTSSGNSETTENVKRISEFPTYKKLVEAVNIALHTGAHIDLDLKGAYIDYKLTVPQLVSMVSADAPIQLYNERTSEYVKLSTRDLVTINPNPEGGFQVTIVGRSDTPIKGDLLKALQPPANIGGYSVKGDYTAPVLQNPELRENVRVLPKKKLILSYAPVTEPTLKKDCLRDEYCVSPDSINLGKAEFPVKQRLGQYYDEFDPITGLSKAHYSARRLGNMNPQHRASLTEVY